MARVQEFYKGRRKRRNYAMIPFIVLLLLFSLAMVLFYGMQKYAVITDDGVSVELPILKDPNATTVDSQGREIKNFERVQAEIVFDEPDYTNVKADPEPNAPPVRAIFIPAENISHDKLLEYAARLVSGNALLLEMKPRSGEMLWESHSQMAMAYSLSMPTERTAQMPELIQMLKDEDIYLVAQISCCIDETLPSRTTAYCVQTETGLIYRDEKGTWLDAYNLDMRTWIAEMVEELYALGFDEVVLADLAHPTLPEENPPVLRYTREMSTARSTDLAACGLAALLGHFFPPWLHFRGGKGVATAAGIYLALAPWTCLLGMGIWLVIVVATGYVSLASCFVLCLGVFVVLFSGVHPFACFWIVCMIAVLVTLRHSGNFRRLASGTERRSKMYFKELINRI